MALAILLLFLGGSAQAACAPPEIRFDRRDIAGRPVLTHLPSKPRGVLYLFHGSGGSERFAERPETLCALEPLWRRGYGFVATRSGMREPPVRWRLDAAGAENVDVAYMLALHGQLTRTGKLPVETPVYAMGMSNGGGFATVFGVSAKAAGLPLAAIANYMGPLPDAALDAAGAPDVLPPLFLVVAENDGIVDPDRVLARAAALSAGGAPLEIHRAVARPLRAEDLEGVNDMGPGEARQALEAIRRVGVIDTNGRRALAADRPRLDRASLREIERVLPTALRDRQILGALVIAFAGHQMRSDFGEAQMRFFEASRPRD
jgi:hypothetical protein